MINEMIIGGIIFYLLFGNYIAARTYEIREKARRMEMENDHLEYGADHEGQEND